MEDENELTSYYEITYLDDYNTKHLGKVGSIEELNFMQNRFNVTQYEFVTNN